ncbi:hypothetical protein [Neomoorella mulderi]|nr:hypothetical protein [Moorella mulderi]
MSKKSKVKYWQREPRRALEVIQPALNMDEEPELIILSTYMTSAEMA